jgi:hypothetical protein
MPQVPSHERPPGIKMPWLQVWRNTLAELKEIGIWAPHLRPLLDEYVWALKGAEDARNGFAWLDHLTETVASEEIDWIALQKIAGGLPTAWDRHAKRAAALADQLCLSPRGAKAAGIGRGTEEEEQEIDGFADLDELAPRRTVAASVG